MRHLRSPLNTFDIYYDKINYATFRVEEHYTTPTPNKGTQHKKYTGISVRFYFLYSNFNSLFRLKSLLRK